MGKYGKKNHVSLNVIDTSVIFLGTPKLGKSTIMKEVAEKLTDPDEGYLFLEMYHERGADKIEGINYENVPDWETFDDIITDIEDNKTTDYPKLQLVVIDTWDNAIELAEKEVIRVWNKENPDKRTDNINATYAGFQKGQAKAAQYLDEMTNRLIDVGVQVWIIMHIKNKEITDPVSGETYQTVTANISQSYFNAINRNKDVIAVGYVDREIVKEKTGKKNIVTKKEETRNVVKDQTRRIKFRDEAYAIDAGGRLSDYIEPEIDFDSDSFIKAIEDALKAKVENAGVSLKDRAKEDASKKKKREAEIAAAEEENRSKKELETVISSIIDACKADKDLAKSVVKECKELGYSNPKEVDDLEVAKKLLAMCE